MSSGGAFGSLPAPLISEAAAIEADTLKGKLEIHDERLGALFV